MELKLVINQPHPHGGRYTELYTPDGKGILTPAKITFSDLELRHEHSFAAILTYLSRGGHQRYGVQVNDISGELKLTIPDSIYNEFIQHVTACLNGGIDERKQ